MALVAILWYVALLWSSALSESRAEELQEVAVVKGDHDFYRALVSDWIAEIRLDNDVKLSRANWEFGRVPVTRNVSISSSRQKFAALNVNGLRNGEIKLNGGVHLNISDLKWENKPDWTPSSEPTKHLFGMFQFEAGAIITFFNCTIAIQLKGCTSTSELSKSKQVSGDNRLDTFEKALLTKGSVFSNNSRITLDQGEVWLQKSHVVCDAGEQLSQKTGHPTVRDARQAFKNPPDCFESLRTNSQNLRMCLHQGVVDDAAEAKSFSLGNIQICSQSLETMVIGLLNVRNNMVEPRLRIEEEHMIYIEFLEGEFLSNEGNSFLASVTDTTIVCASQLQSEFEVLVDPAFLDTESQAVDGKNDFGGELTAEDYEGLVDSDILDEWFSLNTPLKSKSPGNEGRRDSTGTSVVNALTTWWALGIICVGSLLLPMVVKLARRRRYVAAPSPSETTPGPPATSDFEDGGTMNYEYVSNRISSENLGRKIGFLRSMKRARRKDARRLPPTRTQRFRRRPASGKSLSFVYSLRHDSLTKILAKKRQRRAEMMKRLVSPKLTHALRTGTLLPTHRSDFDQRRHNPVLGAKGRKTERSSIDRRRERAAHCASTQSFAGKTHDPLSTVESKPGETKHRSRRIQSRPSSTFLMRMESHCQEASGGTTSEECKGRFTGEGGKRCNYKWIVETNSSLRDGVDTTEETESALLATIAMTFGSRLSLDECRTCVSGDRRVLRLADGEQKSYVDIFGVLENAIGKRDMKDDQTSSEDSEIYYLRSASRNHDKHATGSSQNPGGRSGPVSRFKPSILRKALSEDFRLVQFVRGGLTFAREIRGKLMDRFWDRSDTSNDIQ
ncbi:hypothetical protein BSKO_04139 [Bryopsis sp. KO-2023]|nr:hypothetical protein BSKO_04139 [Bryopsis sp. KO-2023]